MSPACRRFFALALLASTLPLSTAAAGDWPEGLSAQPRFSELAGAIVVNWTVTNTSDSPFAPGTVPIHYSCGNGEVEVINHYFPSALLPGASVSDGDHFLCVAKNGVVSLNVEALDSGFTASDSLIYLMACDQAAKKQLELTWQPKGFYTFKTEEGVSGVVARAVLDDETLLKTACAEFGPPSGETLERVKNWFRDVIFMREGDPEQGYTSEQGHTGSRG
jgi:hypothetical protein